MPNDRGTSSYRVSSTTSVTPTRTVVTGTTTRLTQDPDQTKELYDLIGSYVGGISADGERIAYMSQWAVFVWDRATAITTRITPDGAPNSTTPVISDDGRYVAYTRNAPHHGGLKTGDVLVWDRVSGSTTAVTSNDRGSHADSISGDGRFVAFTSAAPDLVPHDTNKLADVFVWDRLSGAIRRITNGDGWSHEADISANGRWVTFMSEANNLVAHDTNDHTDVFVWDARTGKTRRISRDNTNNWTATVSADGRSVAYVSGRIYNDPYDPRHVDVYVWDRTTGKTSRVTAVTDNTASATISADGNHVVYRSHSTRLAPGDADGRQSDVFVWDRRTRTTTRLISSLNALSPVISGDGSHIAYDAGELDGINGPYDVYLWDAGQ